MNKKRILFIGIPVLLLILGYTFFTSNSEEEVSITTEVIKGEFLNEVIISGEAQSTSLKNIEGPSSLRKFRLNNIKIQDLIPEGSVIKEGDYVGRLDPSHKNS